MKTFLVFLLSCLIAAPLLGQQSIQLFPTLGPKYLNASGYVETARNIFVPSRIFNVQTPPSWRAWYQKSNIINIYKFDKQTSQFVDSVIIGGDTTMSDSVSYISIAACYSNGHLYYLTNYDLYNGGLIPDEALYLTVLDTNLNIVLPNKRITSPKLSLLYKTIFSFIPFQNRLFIAYLVQKQIFMSDYEPRTLQISLEGAYLKDTAIRLIPDTSVRGNSAVFIKEAGNDTSLYVGGNDFADCQTCLYKTDTNFNVLKYYGELNPVPDSSPLGVEMIMSSRTSFSDIHNGLLFTAGEYERYSEVSPCINMPVRTTFISKHRKSNKFIVNKSILIPNSTCQNASENYQPQLKALYSPTDNAVYYVNSNQAGGPRLNCTTSENEVQVICVDTNLNLKWLKLISPKSNTCTRVGQVLLPEQGSGLTIVGNYLNNDFPFDSTQSGTFIIRFDSAGLLSTGSNPQFTIRDRFTVYPNPATNTIWVEDITGVPAKAFLYDLVGRQVATYNLTGRKNQLDLPAGKPGMYLLRIVPQWSDGWSQMVQVNE